LNKLTIKLGPPQIAATERRAAEEASAKVND
jgi:hypothetical protein